MTPEQQTSLKDALDAVTLARSKAERKAGLYQADPMFQDIAGLCAVAQIEIRRALKPENRITNVVIGSKAARVTLWLIPLKSFAIIAASDGST